MKRWLAFLYLITNLLITTNVFAQTPVPVTDDEVNRVAKGLYCPVCENIPLDVCPTEACRQWRLTIREKLELGWTEQQIDEYFAAQYGDRVLAAPPFAGLNILVWVLPPLLVLAGAFLLWRFLRANVAPAPAAPPSPPPTDDYAARLEEELEKRR
jgi:cytochrome c-type biogenesis protein CcmH